MSHEAQLIVITRKQLVRTRKQLVSTRKREAAQQSTARCTVKFVYRKQKYFATCGNGKASSFKRTQHPLTFMPCARILYS